MNLKVLKLIFLFIIIQTSSQFDVRDYNPFKNIQVKSWLDLVNFFVKLSQKVLPNSPTYGYDFYNFFPQYKLNIQPNKSKDIEGKCFSNINFRTEEIKEKQIIRLTIDPTSKYSNLEPKNLICEDFLLVSTLNQFELVTIKTRLKQTYDFKIPKEESLKYDLLEKGIAVFQFPFNSFKTFTNVLQTAKLFAPVASQNVPSYFDDLNANFLNNYVGLNVQKRKTNIVNIPVELIKSGDSFYIRRHDGLDPMISWAMGVNHGHTVVAVKRDGVMQVCEAQTKGAYWPINGVQCNKYEDWIQMARKADYNYVWVPIDRSLEFDEEKANALIDELYGVDYGFQIVIMGWIDTIADNFPCRKRFSSQQEGICLPGELFEYLFSVIERHVPTLSIIWSQAMGQRVGLRDAKLHEIYYKAHQLGIKSTELYTLPEQDSWIYSTTKNGEKVNSKIAVCNMFVCQVLRAGGIFKKFGDVKFQCNEFSLFDLQKLNIYEKNFERPQQCIEADPENPICQLGGTHTLRIDNVPRQGDNFNFIDPVNNMAENCPSLGPIYASEPQC